MQCPQCHREHPLDARFCMQCGKRLALACAECGAELPPEANFCLKCGQSVGEAKTQHPTPEPRSYTPKHLAEKILTSRSALEGERKQVTVLFADVKGSMELAEQVDPEEWHRIMDRFFAILSEGVHRFEGTVNQYTGDGIMALFGAPIAHEDHARRACYAALHLTDELCRYSDELRLNQGLNFAVRMGLNSGEVVVGKIGDDLRMDYTAQGPTVGLAARMEQIAAADRIYLTEHTASLVEGFFRLRDLGPLAVKGVQDRLRVYELQGVGALRTRLDVSRARGFSKFVGRTDEMASLEAALERAFRGNGQVIGVVGEAGVGKSRLCYEFVEACRARGLMVTEAHGVAHGKGIPFLPVLEFFRGYFGITDQDADEMARDKIAGRLLRLDEHFSEVLPLLFDFLGVPDPARPVPRMDPEARQRQLFGMTRQLVHARSQRQPAVILLEDLHWVDGGTEGFVENLVEALPGTRTLVLVNFRPEYQASWVQRSYYQQLALVPLGPEAITDLLYDLLGADPSLVRLGDRIRERTGGNPFFIEEIAQALVETGSLEGTKGAYRLVTPVEEVTIPASVQAVLAARIDRLPEREKQVLQTASVIGRNFSQPILQGVAELADADLAASLGSLQRAEFIYEEALYPEALYAFKHALTQEVTYGSQLGERRRRLHAAVAQAIETGQPNDLDEKAPLLAHHWEGAGDQVAAARWHARSAHWAGINAPAEALRHWRQGRSLLGQDPVSLEAAQLALECRIQILNFGFRTGLSDEEAQEILREGRAMASAGGNVRAEVLLLTAYGVQQWLSGDPKGALDPAEQAVALAEKAGDAEARFTAAIALFQVCRHLGDLRRALKLSDECLAWAEANPETKRSLLGLGVAFALGRRASILSDLGRIQEAADLLRRYEELVRSHGQLDTVNWIQYLRVEVAEISGNVTDVRAGADRFLEYALKSGGAFDVVLSSLTSGTASLLDGEGKQAALVLAQGLESARRDRVSLSVEGLYLARLAEAQSRTGETEKAKATAQEAIRAARQRQTPLIECRAHLALARVLLTRKSAAGHAGIESALANCLSLIEETGARCYEPFIHEELAELARLNGDEAAYQRELREAHRLFTEMGATGHAERLAKELKQAKAPKRKSLAQKPSAKHKTKAAKPGRKAKAKRKSKK